jgi:hypothetical protein
MNTDEFFAEAKRLNLRMLGTPEEIRAALDAKDAEIARLTGMDDAMRAEWDRECGDTDKILRALGLDPANCRTDGGSLKLQMVLGAIEHRDVMLKREARRAAKGLTVQADSDGAWLAFASSTGLHALLNVEHIADSYGGIVSKAIRDWAADVSAAACPSGKCTDPARDCYGSGCLSDEPQSAVAAAHGGLTQTAQG